MTNSYNITRSDINRHPAPFDFYFEWDDGTKKTFIVVSLHAVIALAEAFKGFGYKEAKGSLKILPPKEETLTYTRI